jgi:[NiFe] hydrogenase large subunit
VRCVENAGKTTIPENARILRNLMMGAQFVHDHLIHFYHLHLLDWVDVLKAASADANATAALAKTLSPTAPAIDFAKVKSRLQGFVGSKQLGVFAQGYWGHPAYLLTPEENLLFMAHYFEALRKQVTVGKMQAIWGGKNPHPQSMLVGGLTCKPELTDARIGDFNKYLKDVQAFVRTVYLPDVSYLAKKYKSYAALGQSQNFLSFGEFPLGNIEPDQLFFPRGQIMDANVAAVGPVDTSQITEHVKHSWYAGASAPHPSAGSTEPAYAPYNPNGKYSWLKAPRYSGKPMEAGPLARMLVAYGKGMAQAVTAMDGFFAATGLTLSSFNSTLGRTAARALETGIIADAMNQWTAGLNPSGECKVSPPPVSNAQGMGLNEAPRGAVGHWVDVKDGKISNYQMVIPSGWNFSPRCGADIAGPVESALVGTPVADPARPLEILRTVHSFDPCISCAIHVIDGRKKGAFIVRAG